MAALRTGRGKAALAAVAAALAAAGIVIPGLGDDEPAAPAPPPLSATTEQVETAAFPGHVELVAIRHTLRAIESGEPLPYEEDGGVFQNREGLLPAKPIGYYREYTVETPGSPDRGARRLVIGEAGEMYYTDDHYGSFREFDPEVFR